MRKDKKKNVNEPIKFKKAKVEKKLLTEERKENLKKSGKEILGIAARGMVYGAATLAGVNLMGAAFGAIGKHATHHK